MKLALVESEATLALRNVLRKHDADCSKVTVEIFGLNHRAAGSLTNLGFMEVNMTGDDDFDGDDEEDEGPQALPSISVFFSRRTWQSPCLVGTRTHLFMSIMIAPMSSRKS